MASLERKFANRFVTAYSAKSLISLLQYFLTLRTKKSGPFIAATLFDASNVRFALSVSMFSYLYHVLKKKLTKDASDSKASAKSFIAGSLASLCFLIDSKKNRSTISHMVFVRTLYFGVRAFVYTSSTTAHPKRVKQDGRSVSILDQKIETDRFGNDYVAVDPSIGLKSSLDRLKNKTKVAKPLKIRKSNSIAANKLRYLIDKYG